VKGFVSGGNRSISRRVLPLALGLVSVIALGSAPLWLDAFSLSFLLKVLIWGLFAASFDVLFGYAGLLSLGHSVYFGLGAYGAAWMTLSYGPEVFPWALGAGVLLGGLAAAAIGALAVRTGSHGFIIVTAVTALIAFLGAQSRRDLTGGDDGLTLSAMPLALGGWRAGCADPGPAYLFALGIVLLGLGALGTMIRSPLGLALRCLRENELRAQALGYDVYALKWLAFTVAGLGAALAGALYALVNCHVSAALFGWLVSADVLIWTLFGGAGTLVGPLVGTGVFLSLRELLSDLWPAGYPVLVGLALLGIARFLPRGLVGGLRTRGLGPTRKGEGP